jgi:antitoxin (DNA-binding transcriptional repressor) of toxin-antitoxin stability system
MIGVQFVPFYAEITMNPIPIEEAQARLPELIDKLLPGEEVAIIRGEQRVAKLVSEAVSEGKRRVPGLGKGQILYMADDFDAPLEDFKEYME